MAAAFLVLHVNSLAPTPGSIDSVNFILGVRDFELADHRPHPPGYPAFMALGKVSRGIAQRVSALAPDDPIRLETRALAVWSALLGALALFPLVRIFRLLGTDDRGAVAAVALTAACPLYWFTATRPMSDISGLAAALIAQALLIADWRREQTAAPPRANGSPWRQRPLLVAGAVAAGAAIGFRSQNLWLTVPLLSVLLFREMRQRAFRGLVVVMAAFVAGVLAWGIPLLVASGGLDAYLRALSAQGGEDFAGADMLVTHPTPRRLVRGLVWTVAYPWGDKHLALIVIGLALIGSTAMWWRVRESAKILCITCLPYAIFHLLFQEPTASRYALPLVPAVSYLAVRGLDVFPRPVTPWLVAGLVAASLSIALPPATLYAREGNPAYRAVSDIERRLAASKEPGAAKPVLGLHHAVARVLRARHLESRVLPSAPMHEWLSLVEYWKAGGRAPVWFLAEPGRHDLAVIDRNSRRLVRSYDWPFERKFLMTNVRPGGVVWYEMRPPGWMAGEGWSLTPELAGVAWRDGRGPHREPIVAFLRRRSEGAILLVGGRHLGGMGDPPIPIEVSLDGRTIESWVVPPGAFLKTWRLPAGSLGGRDDYAALTIRSRSMEPGDTARVAIEQFDVQSEGSLVVGFDSGWYEQEYDSEADRSWRWATRSATLRIFHPRRDVVLEMTGERPLTYLDQAPTVTVRAGGEELARVIVDGALALRVRIPARALEGSGGILTIETDRDFVPDVVFGNGDRRALSLRVFDARLH